ncbi:kinesin kif17, partial [Brachionus plicatilis]
SNSVLCAAGGLANSDNLLLISCANCQVVLTPTIINSPVFLGSAYWYLTDGKSFGFAPDSTVNQHNADTHDTSSPYRLSWHLSGIDSSENGRYFVRTITLDDLVAYLPKRSNGLKYKKAVLKIDIEGFELYVFKNASRLFDAVDIRAVFMEWGNMPKLIDHYDKVENMIKFFKKRNYVPIKINQPLTEYKLINYFVDLFRTENKLPIRYWENWSWDVVWLKK